MSTFFLKFFKIFIINTLLILSFALVVELLFGYWFDKDNFGPHMREHRMKNQKLAQTTSGKANTSLKSQTRA